MRAGVDASSMARLAAAVRTLRYHDAGPDVFQVEQIDASDPSRHSLAPDRCPTRIQVRTRTSVRLKEDQGGMHVGSHSFMPLA